MSHTKEKTLRVSFVDDAGWARGFVERYLSKLVKFTSLTQQEANRTEPDIVFFSDGKQSTHRNFRASKKVFITSENLYPDFSTTDYALAYQYIKHERYLRMPYWALITPHESLIKPKDFAERVIAQPRDFCCFVQSNGNVRRTRRRLDFFQAISRVRFVHSGGSVLNNIGYRVSDIHAFLKQFQFSICFENSRSKGYTSEKLTNAMINGCIPVYWGDPLVGADFNPESFINVSDFPNDIDAIRYICTVAENQYLRKRYLDAPFFKGNLQPAVLDENRILSFFSKIIFAPPPKRLRYSLGAFLFKMKHKIGPYLPVIRGNQ
jgi:hypothetical protein